MSYFSFCVFQLFSVNTLWVSLWEVLNIFTQMFVKWSFADLLYVGKDEIYAFINSDFALISSDAIHLVESEWWT